MNLSLQIIQIDDAHPMWIGVAADKMLSDGNVGYVRKSEWPEIKKQLDSIAALRSVGVLVNQPDDQPPVLAGAPK